MYLCMEVTMHIEKAIEYMVPFSADYVKLVLFRFTLVLQDINGYIVSLKRKQLTNKANGKFKPQLTECIFCVCCLYLFLRRQSIMQSDHKHKTFLLPCQAKPTKWRYK